METIILDEQFRSILPALDKKTYSLLEENILQHGCITPLVLWEGILVDGYNRYSICTERDIPFQTVEKGFASREEALIWIISNQVSRRNLTPMLLSYYRGLHYRSEKKIAGNYTGRNRHSGQSGQIDHIIESTSKRLSQQYHISPKTIRRDSRLADAIDAIGEASPDAKSRILSGEVDINKSTLESLSPGQSAEIASLAAEIAEGTYEKRAALTDPLDDGLGTGGPRAPRTAAPTEPLSSQQQRAYRMAMLL